MPPKKAQKKPVAKKPAAPAGPPPPPLPDSPNHLRSHEPLVERGGARSRAIINALRGAAAGLLRKEDLTFRQQVEVWPYLFWPPLPQWYTLPLKANMKKMAHDMNTADRLEQYAVSGLFSDPPRLDYGGNLFYTNLIIPLFHTYRPPDQKPVTVWSFLHYKKGGKSRKADDGEFKRQEHDAKQKICWHVLTRWHADLFEDDVKEYVRGLKIDGVLKNEPVFADTHEFSTCVNVDNDNDEVEYHENGEADPARYARHTFSFCLLAIAHLALDMLKDLDTDACGIPPFNTQNTTIHGVPPMNPPEGEAGQGGGPADAPEDVDVTDEERAAAILLLGIRNVFEHSRVRLTDPADETATLDLDALEQDEDNRWAMAGAHFALDMVDDFRLSVKMTWGGPYNSVHAAEGEDGDDNGGNGGDNNDDQSKHGSQGRQGSESGGGGPGGKKTDNSGNSNNNPPEESQQQPHEESQRKPQGNESLKPLESEAAKNNKGVQQEKKDEKAAGGFERGLESPTKKRKRSKDSLFSAFSEESGPAAKKPKLSRFENQATVEDATDEGESGGESWKGFDEEVEAALREGFDDADDSKGNKDDSTESSESGYDEEEEEFTDDSEGTGSEDSDESDGSEDVEMEYMPEYNMLYMSM